jgi:L-2,4-diaminobutyrate decarboxylase
MSSAGGWTERVARAYAPDEARALVDEASRAFARYLEACQGREAPVMPPGTPAAFYEAASALLDGPKGSAPGAPGFAQLAEVFLHGCHRIHSPRDMGHQVAPALPAAGAFDALASLTNQGLAVAEMGPFAAAAERVLIDRLAARIGWTGGYGGVVTGGGTLANLTAVLAARNARYRSAFRSGVPAGVRPAVLTSGDTHYSVARAGGILGIGTDQVLKVPVDARRKMTGQAVAAALRAATEDGNDVFCIVASAPSTATGTFDEIVEIARVARENRIWLHVDAAHGGGLLLSPRLAGRLAGIAAADSVTWDAHKMMHVPSLSTFLLYRDGAQSFLPFEQEAPYLFDAAPDDERLLNGGLRTVECTKRALSLAVWGVWALYGEELFRDVVERTVDTTRAWYERLRAMPDFVPLHEPEANILCFRHVPTGAEAAGVDVSELQRALREALIAEGRFYITLTRFADGYALRTSIMNPLTGAGDLEELLEALRRLARVCYRKG